jgi:hypothetical protein
MAREAPITERISIQWPRSMMFDKGHQFPEEELARKTEDDAEM